MTGAEPLEIIKRRIGSYGNQYTAALSFLASQHSEEQQGVDWKISRKLARECSYLSSLPRVSGARQVYESSRPSRPALHFRDIIFLAVRELASPLPSTILSDKVVEITVYDDQQTARRDIPELCPFFRLFLFFSFSLHSPIRKQPRQRTSPRCFSHYFRVSWLTHKAKPLQLLSRNHRNNRSTNDATKSGERAFLQWKNVNSQDAKVGDSLSRRGSDIG